MKTLQIIETAYRATLEEQDDTIVWITHAMTGAGAGLDVLLRGNAVNYAVANQSVEPLTIGGRVQANAPDIARDVAALVPKGVAVHVVADDLAARGIDASELVDGAQLVAAADLAGLVEGYAKVFHW